MNRRIIAVATLMLLVVMSLASCSDNDEDKTAGKVRQLTVVFSTGGLGDNGYNDKIMQGVMNFAGSHTEGKLPLWASVRSFSHVYSVAGGSNGSLTGYAAGLKRKQGLLDIERG